jgi:hypothetical protein
LSKSVAAEARDSLSRFAAWSSMPATTAAAFEQKRGRRGPRFIVPLRGLVIDAGDDCGRV